MNDEIRYTIYEQRKKARAKRDKGAFSPELVAPILTRAFLIKTISVILVALMLAQDIARANPQGLSSAPSQSTLGIPTLFQSLRVETDIKTLEVTLKYILQVIGHDGIEKFRYHLAPEVAGVRLDLDFDKMRKDPDGAIIVPCRVSKERSYRHFEALINVDGSVSIAVKDNKETLSKSIPDPSPTEETAPDTNLETPPKTTDDGIGDAGKSKLNRESIVDSAAIVSIALSVIYTAYTIAQGSGLTQIIEKYIPTIGAWVIIIAIGLAIFWPKKRIATNFTDNFNFMYHGTSLGVVKAAMSSTGRLGGIPGVKKLINEAEGIADSDEEFILPRNRLGLLGYFIVCTRYANRTVRRGGTIFNIFRESLGRDFKDFPTMEDFAKQVIIRIPLDKITEEIAIDSLASHNSSFLVKISGKEGVNLSTTEILSTEYLPLDIVQAEPVFSDLVKQYNPAADTLSQSDRRLVKNLLNDMKRAKENIKYLKTKLSKAKWVPLSKFLADEQSAYSENTSSSIPRSDTNKKGTPRTTNRYRTAPSLRLDENTYSASSYAQSSLQSGLFQDANSPYADGSQRPKLRAVDGGLKAGGFRAFYYKKSDVNKANSGRGAKQLPPFLAQSNPQIFDEQFLNRIIDSIDDPGNYSYLNNDLMVKIMDYVFQANKQAFTDELKKKVIAIIANNKAGSYGRAMRILHYFYLVKGENVSRDFAEHKLSVFPNGKELTSKKREILIYLERIYFEVIPSVLELNNAGSQQLTRAVTLHELSELQKKDMLNEESISLLKKRLVDKIIPGIKIMEFLYKYTADIAIDILVPPVDSYPEKDSFSLTEKVMLSTDVPAIQMRVGHSKGYNLVPMHFGPLPITAFNIFYYYKLGIINNGLFSYAENIYHMPFYSIRSLDSFGNQIMPLVALLYNLGCFVADPDFIRQYLNADDAIDKIDISVAGKEGYYLGRYGGQLPIPQTSLFTMANVGWVKQDQGVFAFYSGLELFTYLSTAINRSLSNNSSPDTIELKNIYTEFVRTLEGWFKYHNLSKDKIDHIIGRHEGPIDNAVLRNAARFMREFLRDEKCKEDLNAMVDRALKQIKTVLFKSSLFIRIAGLAESGEIEIGNILPTIIEVLFSNFVQESERESARELLKKAGGSLAEKALAGDKNNSLKNPAKKNKASNLGEKERGGVANRYYIAPLSQLSGNVNPNNSYAQRSLQGGLFRDANLPYMNERKRRARGTVGGFGLTEFRAFYNGDINRTAGSSETKSPLRDALWQVMHAQGAKFIHIYDMDAMAVTAKISVVKDGQEASKTLGDKQEKFIKYILNARDKIYSYSHGKIKVSDELYIIIRLPDQLAVIDKDGGIQIDSKKIRAICDGNATIISYAAVADLTMFYAALAAAQREACQKDEKEPIAVKEPQSSVSQECVIKDIKIDEDAKCPRINITLDYKDNKDLRINIATYRKDWNNAPKKDPSFIPFMIEAFKQQNNRRWLTKIYTELVKHQDKWKSTIEPFPENGLLELFKLAEQFGLSPDQSSENGNGFTAKVDNSGITWAVEPQSSRRLVKEFICRALEQEKNAGALAFIIEEMKNEKQKAEWKGVVNYTPGDFPRACRELFAASAAKVDSGEVPKNSRHPPGSPLGVFILLLNEDRPLNMVQICSILNRKHSTIRSDISALMSYLGLVIKDTKSLYSLTEEVREHANRIVPVLVKLNDNYGHSPKANQLRSIKPEIDRILQGPEDTAINLWEELKGKTFGEKIKYLRMRNGWSSAKLAKYSGISQTTLSCIENGHIPGVPWDSTVAGLAAALGVEKSLLLEKGGEASSDLLPEETYLDRNLSALENEDLVNVIKRLAHLNEQQELVIRLIYSEGKTAKEAAKILGVSEKRVYRIRREALKELRRAAKVMKIWDNPDANTKTVRTPGVLKAASNTSTAPFLRDIVNPEELTQNMIEGVLSALFSNKKLTLAFSRKLKGLESVQLRALLRQLKEWKISTAQKNSKMKALLDNFTVLEYDDFKTALDERGIDANASDGLIFTYAPKPLSELENTANFGSTVKPVYIIEQDGGFPANYYYPLFEMVTVSLAKELLHWDESQLREALAASNITADTFGIDTIIDERLGILIFKVLPKMERYENDSRIDRYTRLLQFLHSA